MSCDVWRVSNVSCLLSWVETPKVGCNANLPLLLCSETVGEAIKWQTLSSSSVIDVYSLCSFSNLFLEGFACNTDLPKVRGLVMFRYVNASKIKIVCSERRNTCHMYAVLGYIKTRDRKLMFTSDKVSKISTILYFFFCCHCLSKTLFSHMFLHKHFPDTKIFGSLINSYNNI